MEDVSIVLLAGLGFGLGYASLGRLCEEGIS